MLNDRLMRPIHVAFMMLPCLACDKDDKAKELEQKVSGSSTTTVTTSSAPRTPVDAAAAPPASVVMPERPIPKGQTMVGMGAPEEVQMKAITYMAAMRSPHPGDANADPTYAADLQNKLKPINLGLDKGPDKAKWNRVDVVANGREINLLMSQGCDPETPKRAVVNGAGVQLATLVQHGVLVIKCNDTKVQCLQSTRDAEDVLCTTGIRHK
jgi:hypothetical protein